MARPMRNERGVFANSNISQREVIAWLDAQEQKLFLRVGHSLMDIFHVRRSVTNPALILFA